MDVHFTQCYLGQTTNCKTTMQLQIVEYARNLLFIIMENKILLQRY
jgi:hypothetical protein